MLFRTFSELLIYSRRPFLPDSSFPTFLLLLLEIFFFCSVKTIKKSNGFSTPPFFFNLAMFLDWLPPSSWSHLLFIWLSNASSGGWINTGKSVLPCRQCHSRCHTVTERRQAHKICGLFICPPTSPKSDIIFASFNDSFHCIRWRGKAESSNPP